MKTENFADGPISNHLRVTVNDQNFQIGDDSPIGRQILALAGLHPAADYALIQLNVDGNVEELGPDEKVAVAVDQTNRFYAWKADRLFYFTLDERKFPWTEEISEAMLRDLGQITDDKEIWLDRRGAPDLLIEQGAHVSLKGGGVERLYTKSRVWKLDVQGTIIESDSRHIQVQSALEKAGIDLTKKWTFILKVIDQPKRSVELGTVIDLGTPGIERLRLIPDKINNGDGRALRRHFNLLPKDNAYLNQQHPEWETVIDKDCRWLLLSNYLLPSGFTAASTEMAILIPSPYPAAEVDMFYCYPPLALATGVPISQTESHVDIGGLQFQRWSRHRDGGVWSPAHDSILTHMGLVEESLNREVGL